MHAEAYAWIQSVVDRLDDPQTVVELGSRNINGTTRDFFDGHTRYIGVDVLPGPGVDVVCDAATYWTDVSPDLVICAETLEHAASAEAIVKNAVRLVRPGGYVIVTCASPRRPPHSGVDGGPIRPGEYYAGLDATTVANWGRIVGAQLCEATDHPHGDAYVWLRKPA